MKIDLRIGDCLAILPTLPDNSVQRVVTSPPYWGLRDYGAEGQLGLKRTPEEYVAKMVQVFREVRRVLREDGTCWLNLGDSYSSGGGDTYTGFNERYDGTGINGKQTETHKYFEKRNATNLPPKNLVGIPWRVAFALQADGWWLRQDIIWHKPNPMPESVTDRCTKAHEYVFLLTKSARYFYDNEAVKEPQTESTTNRYKYGWNGVDDDNSNGARTGSAFKKMKAGMNMGDAMGGNGFRNRRDVWTISTESYHEAHFATMPTKLVEPCILAGSKPGDVVLDPFNGAGTVGLVATRLGRNYIGIELNPEYVKMTERRLGAVQPMMAVMA